MAADASAGSGSSVTGSPIAHLGSVTFSARCEISLSLCLNRGEISLCVNRGEISLCV